MSKKHRRSYVKNYNSIDIRRIDEETMDGQIITSFLEDDFYKYPMGQFIWDHEKYKSAEVEWRFKNRTTEVPLADHVSEKDFMDQIALIKNLRLDSSEHHYLRGTFEYRQRMFSDDYLDYLCNFNMPEFIFRITKDRQLDIRWKDAWIKSTYGELPVLKIVNGLYYRSVMSKMSRLEREAIYAEGIIRLAEKIKRFKLHPNTVFSDFSNRRAFSSSWLEYIVLRTADELGKQFKGTSKTSLAMKHSFMPTGTKAHELDMIPVAMAFDGTKESISNTLMSVLEQWYDQYGEGLAIILPDTYGTEFYLNIMPDGLVRRTRGSRIDSMNPMDAIPINMARFKRAGVDPKEKLFIPSDGLKDESMIQITDTFHNQAIISHGYGTHYGNDLGLKTLSIVCKPYSANGKYCVKLTDNIAKGMGEQKEQESYKKALGYSITFNEQPEV